MIITSDQEQEYSPDYIQKVAAAGDDQLVELALPILLKSVMFSYWVSQNYQ